ncbi:diguanylate cyclase [Allorhizocola rhizosphaerae]|uniref:diguanylate cyclase n=1 Tax=Allorhizocola rhizosphaerae TaxID=1872709 RepID=UPI000E3DD77C|nr:diguanylate cyclase [Allorhizocola rhizosphaerae]
MGADRESLVQDLTRAAVRVEILHSSERARVSRLYLPGGSVIRKEPLGPGRDERLRHESAVLERLSGVPGVVALADSPPCPDSLVLADLGGTTLAATRMPVDASELLRLALELAAVLTEMHRRGVVHRDINPANIVLSEDGRKPRLIDFALATTFAGLRPEFIHHNKIVGTLPYLAPESTGRTGRPVDQRVDLYALGATLYELATGVPPFGTGDPLRLVHDLLTRVPLPPDRVNRAVPADLSQIIMHLLEKEPDNRYQTAEGLLHDLIQVRDGFAVRVGEHDFPARLRAPTRLVGRSDEIAGLRSAFAAAMVGKCRGVLVSGAAGVGKTALINELRPVVTAAGGWFVTGKFDQYRRDLEFDAVAQAFRALGRLLLAEPEPELDKVRVRILSALGPNAGLAAAVLPELATLLQVPPDPGDPMTAEVRAQTIAVEILRAVASRERPVVFVVDDLQWAARTPLGFIDAVLSGQEEVEGLLLVGAHRSQGVDAIHPLAGMLSHWGQQGDAVRFVRLESLPVSGVAALVADMLRLDGKRAEELAAAIIPHTAGNPYETVELLNALRDDGVLKPGAGGWRWSPALLQQRLNQGDGVGLMDRADAIPSATRAVVEAMACLGGEVELDVLGVAFDRSAADLESQLAPALDGGLLARETATRQVVRFSHDRAREAVLAHMERQRQRALRLGMARRLATRPDLFAAAAEQYLAVLDADAEALHDPALHDPAERRRVVELLRRAAEQANLLSNHPVVERCLTAAGRLADPTDTATLIKVHTGRHAALYGLGRLEEADEVYQLVDRLCKDPLQRVDATSVQVISLTNRSRPREAVDLGLELLRQLGVTAPPPGQLGAEIEDGLDALYRWVEDSDADDDLRRPDITDPTLLAVGTLMSRIMPAAFFCDHDVMAWLILTATRIWAEHGPARTLLSPISHIMVVTVARRQDYRTGYRLMRRILNVADKRGHEPDASRARFLYVMTAGHWFEPLEDLLPMFEHAREGLIRGGDLQNAGYIVDVAARLLIDCAPSLDSYIAGGQAALAVAQRTGNDQSAQVVSAFQRLVDLLRGEGGSLAADQLGAAAEMHSNDPFVMAIIQTNGALAVALLGDQAQLQHRTAALMPTLPALVTLYHMVWGYLLQALALAGQARSTVAEERGAVLAELDTTIEWIAARAADAPVNFLHLLRLVEAERAWALGDFRTAAQGFDAAQREALLRQRPWHRALILERAARFHLAHGMEYLGTSLLSQARREYLAWGATGKVRQLDRAYPTLRAGRHLPAQAADETSGGPPARQSTPTPGAVDLLGILAASRALSSETSITRLRARVTEVLSAMTGATGIHLLLRSDDQHRWMLATAETADSGLVPLDEAGQAGDLPLSVVRYAERTREPLLVADATREDRFARDPYFAGLECCSLLAVPILNRGILQALLLLENRLIHGAFSTERLDGVMLIAGQLAVSLDNALVYASLERKVAERSQQLAVANSRLELLSVTDPLTGLANRRRLDDTLEAEWRRAQQSGTTLGLAMVDIDHFKLYNDHYGHPAGDRCIQRIAAELKRHVRNTDLAARYGGEEFAVVMPKTDADSARQTAERLRTAVVALAEPHILVPGRVVTVSIGVAAILPAAQDTARQLVETADVELYRAKRGGRNQVRAAP